MSSLKFITDVNIEKPIVDYLLESGFDIKWVADYNCELRDADLLSLANREHRILITNDKDFGELVFLQQKVSTGIILLRVKGQNTGDKVALIKKLLRHHQDKLAKHFTVVTMNKIRIIPLQELKI
jgi:predicted nuclease of predicted toxin-antitoxin system